MRIRRPAATSLGVILIACLRSTALSGDSAHAVTNHAIAVENLDQQIAQLQGEPGVEDLLLFRARFLADYEALDRATTTAEDRFHTSTELLRRARTRSAVHRFADALADIDLAVRGGADGGGPGALRASILVATGHANDAIPELEEAVARAPGYSSRSALAAAYAATGRFAEADGLYVAAMEDLNTTLPFPYAWILFARGLMWSEEAGNCEQGEALYVQALAYLPEFVAGNIHLAELEVAYGDLAGAMARLERITRNNDEPEAMGLLGSLHVRAGDPTRGRREISSAGQRFEALLARQPLAFADHAAEFYLGPGADAERAWVLAGQNLANRETGRALSLAIRAAQATGREREERALVARAKARNVPVRPDSWQALVAR